MGAREHALLAEATARLIVARAQLAFVPFPRLARTMGGFVAPQRAADHDAPVTSAAHQAVAREIGWAVTRAAAHLPFSAVCLPQAMAAREMLRRRGIGSVLHFGTARGEAASLEAHAWLNVGAVEVTGYPLDERFTEIACIAG